MPGCFSWLLLLPIVPYLILSAAPSVRISLCLCLCPCPVWLGGAGSDDLILQHCLRLSKLGTHAPKPLPPPHCRPACAQEPETSGAPHHDRRQRTSVNSPSRRARHPSVTIAPHPSTHVGLKMAALPLAGVEERCNKHARLEDSETEETSAKGHQFLLKYSQ